MVINGPEALMTKSYVSYNQSEIILRFIVGIALYVISAILTLTLLLQFSDWTFFRTAFLVLISISIEGAKLLAWRSHHRVFASCLIALSILGSFGTALSTVSKTSETTFTQSLANIKNSSEYLTKQTNLQSYDKEIDLLMEKLANLPADYTTASLKLSSAITDARNTRTAIAESLSALEGMAGSKPAADMFSIIALTFHIPSTVLTLFVLMFLACCIEVGAIIMTEKPKAQNQAVNEPSDIQTGKDEEIPVLAVPTPSYERPTDIQNGISPADFLKAAKEGAKYPYIHGRDVTAMKLGLGYGEAKKMVKTLVESGQVSVKGKRLVLNEPKAS
jgi:hypothetical protein